MNISELFIRRPVMTTLVMAGILIFGFMGYRVLPVSDLPNVDFPTIQVTARLPGGSPETMASSVATPLEKQFSTIAGLDSMSSVNALGLTQITLQFALDRGADARRKQRRQLGQQPGAGPEQAGLERRVVAGLLQGRDHLVGKMVRSRMADETADGMPVHRHTRAAIRRTFSKSSSVGRSSGNTGAPIWRLREAAIAPSATTLATTRAQAAP